MDEDAGIVFMILFWVTLAVAVIQRFWTIRRLRKKLDRIADAAIAARSPTLAPVPAPSAQVEAGELRRIQERLQVLERIAVEKEDTLSRQIEELRVAGR
jgi:hypothetical protein